jgi:hypothetical protein
MSCVLESSMWSGGVQQEITLQNTTLRTAKASSVKRNGNNKS